MKEEIRKFIEAYAAEKDKEGLIANIWRCPLVAFGNAQNPDIAVLRKVAHSQHILPWELLPEAKTIIAFFFPFTKEIADSNKKDRLSSEEWAMAYEKTNAALISLCRDLVSFLQARGYRAAFPQEAFQYDETILQSLWSQRHIAYFCGLGAFGHNNMLITEAGACGRIGTVVTDLEVEYDAVIKEEYCGFKAEGACGACIKRCPVGALTPKGYEPRLCNSLCDENAAVHRGYGCSYVLADSGKEVAGSNTCGKCVVGLPCTLKIPKKREK
ncbi:MAG: epoxyqueuosine reductase [Bacillota bacterium]|nr:epoxyqueuosine reductase [Bacillota bacterium]